MENLKVLKKNFGGPNSMRWRGSFVSYFIFFRVQHMYHIFSHMHHIFFLSKKHTTLAYKCESTVPQRPWCKLTPPVWCSVVECVARDAKHRMHVIPHTRMRAIESHPVTNHHVILGFFLLECMYVCACVWACVRTFVWVWVWVSVWVCA